MNINIYNTNKLNPFLKSYILRKEVLVRWSLHCLQLYLDPLLKGKTSVIGFYIEHKVTPV